MKIKSITLLALLLTLLIGCLDEDNPPPDTINLNCSVIVDISQLNTAGTLSEDDCTVEALFPTHADAQGNKTLVDIFRASIQDTLIVTINLKSSDFNSFLGVYDADLSIPVIRVNDDSGEGSNARIQLKMVPGVYLFVVGQNESAAKIGAYSLNLQIDIDELDFTFGSDGKMISSGEFDVGSTLKIATDSQNRILIAGTQGNTFKIIRLLEDGSIESNHGFIINPAATSLILHDFKIDLQDRILLSGIAKEGSNVESFIVRFNADLSLDATFNGTAVANATGQFAIDASNRIISSLGTTVTRLSNDGTNDNSFTTTTFNISANEVIANIVTDTQHFIAGTADGDTVSKEFYVTKIKENGGIDKSFGLGDGIQRHSIKAVNTLKKLIRLSTSADSEFILTGTAADSTSSNDKNFAALKINKFGALNTSFGDNGKKIYDIGSQDEMNNASYDTKTSKIFMVGSNGNDFTVVKIKSNDGALDTDFGSSNGLKTVAFSANKDTAIDSVLDSKRRLVVVGNVNGGTQWGVMRFITLE